MSHLKVPKLGTVESVLLITAVGFAAYVGWRVYSTGAKIKDVVGKSLTDSKNGVLNAGNRVSNSIMPFNPPKQSTQDNRDVGENEIAAELQAPMNVAPVYIDPLGNVGFSFEPNAGRFNTRPQVSSPSAITAMDEISVDPMGNVIATEGAKP